MSGTTSVKPRRPLLIECDISIRTYDIDFAGHVSNIVYLRWMEDMRWRLFEQHCPIRPLIEQGLQPIIKSTQIEYRVPVKLFDKPKGYMWIASISSASLQFEGEVHLNGQVAAHATHKGLFINAKTGRPQRLPDIFVHTFREAESKS